MTTTAPTPARVEGLPLRGGERVLAEFRPAWASVIVRALPWAAVLSVVVFATGWAWSFLPAASGVWRWGSMRPLVGAAVLIELVVIACAVLDLLTTRYVLTDQRALTRSGWLRSVLVEVPRTGMLDAAVTRTLLQRLFDLGNLGVSTASDGGGYALVWSMISRPTERLALLRDAGAAGQRGEAMGASKAVEPLVIGLAGGIASGKSRVASEFEALGCMVIDSDKLAREALDRPEVRAELVRWWGPGILKPEAAAPGEPAGTIGGPTDGHVDRSKVAAIVFSKPEERRRLEALIHPLVRQSRREMIDAAVRSGSVPRAVIVDAPLLFEAGLDRECDAVVFVDAPREVRLSRVMSKRGWTEEELDRREGAQLGLGEKRARSDFVVANHPGASDLREQVRKVLEGAQRGGRNDR